MGNSHDRDIPKEVIAEKVFFKVLLLGSRGIGKSSLLYQYVQKEFYHQKTTGYADYMVKEVDFDGRQYRLQIWDTAGQERFQGLGVSFYQGVDAGIFVFDLTDQKSFASLEQIYQTYCENVGGRTKEGEERPKIVVVGSKLDKIKSGECERGVEESLISQFCMEHGNAPYFETSALENTNLDLVFEAVIKKEPGNWSLNVKPARQE